jgi:hypothetical protein
MPSGRWWPQPAGQSGGESKTTDITDFIDRDAPATSRNPIRVSWFPIGSPRMPPGGLARSPELIPGRRGRASGGAQLLPFLAQQLAGLPVDEMHSGAGGAGYAFVVPVLFHLRIVRRPQGLHL